MNMSVRSLLNCHDNVTVWSFLGKCTSAPPHSTPMARAGHRSGEAAFTQFSAVEHPGGGTFSLSCPPVRKTWPGRRPCLGSSAQEPSARMMTCDLQARSIPVSEQLSCTKTHANGSGESGLLEIFPEIWGRQGLGPHWSAEGPWSGCVGCPCSWAAPIGGARCQCRSDEGRAGQTWL